MSHSTSKALAKRLEEVLLNGRWIANTNFYNQISPLNWEEATQKIENLNTIAALTYHINYYLGGILNVFDGGELDIKDQFSFDMPTINTDEDWEKLREDFLKNSEKLILHVKNMPHKKLDEIFVEEKYGTYLRNIEGAIEHAYYHLGQISLLKKLIAIN